MTRGAAAAGLAAVAIAAVAVVVAAGTLRGDDAPRGGGDRAPAVPRGTPATPATLAETIGDARPGATIVLRAGRYPALTLARRVHLVGTRGAVLAGVKIARAGSGSRLERLDIRGGVVLADGGVHDVAVARSRISGPGDGVYMGPGSRRVRIEDNTITAPKGDGVVLNSQSHRPGAPNPGSPALAPIDDVTISGNHLYDIGADAIRPANFGRVVVEGNEIEGLEETGDHSDALQSVMGGRELVFRRNFVHDNTGQGFFIKDGLVDHAVVEGNLFVRDRMAGHRKTVPTGGFQIAVYETRNLELRDNTVWDVDLGVAVGWNVGRATVEGNLFQDMIIDPGTGDPTAHPPIEQSGNLIAGGWNWGARPGDVKGPPRFVDAAAGDYRLARGGGYGADRTLARASTRLQESQASANVAGSDAANSAAG